MAFSVTINGNTYTQANFAGLNYSDEDTGLPAALKDVVEHTRDAYKSGSSSTLNFGTINVSDTINVTLDIDRPFGNGFPLTIEPVAGGGDYIHGRVQTYNATTGVTSILVDLKSGTASGSAWTVFMDINKWWANSVQAAIDAETNAGVSESNASASAAAALASEQAAAASEALVLAAADAFDDTYLGAYATEPFTDNDTDPLQTGAIFFDTATNVMKVWNGATWQAVYTESGSGSAALVTTTATGGITVFDVQAALEELHSVKARLDGATFTGAVNANAGLTVTGNSTLNGNTAVTGNITVTGLVDNRDIAGDGSKLDNIEPFAKDDQVASEVPFNNVASGLTATDVQAALDELNTEKMDKTGGTFTSGIAVTGNITVTGLVDNRDIAGDGSKLDNIEPFAKDDQVASEVPFTPGVSGMVATDVQAAILEIDTRVDATESKLSGIENNAKDDQVASEVPVTPVGGITTSDVQAALQELDGRVGTTEGSNHSHSNKAILDATTASFTTADETKLDNIQDNAVALPVPDTTAVVKGSVDATKQVRIEVDGLTTATTRVITMPDNDVNLGTDFEPADATILKDADINNSVQPYDANIPLAVASTVEMQAGTQTATRHMSPSLIKDAIQSSLNQGPTFPFTTATSVTANNAVVLDPGGTVSAVTTTLTGSQARVEHDSVGVDTNTADQGCVAYNSTLTEGIMIYGDYFSTSYGIRLYPFKLAGNVPMFSSPYTISTSGVSVSEVQGSAIIFIPELDRYIVLYESVTAGNVVLRVVEMSGTSITLGPELAIGPLLASRDARGGTNRAPKIQWNAATSTFYALDSGGASLIMVRAFTVDTGTNTITEKGYSGSLSVFFNYTTATLGLDPTSGKLIVITSYNQNGQSCYVSGFVCTDTGSAITNGFENVFYSDPEDSGEYEALDLVVNNSNNQVVLFAVLPLSSSSNAVHSFPLTVSGTDLVVGTSGLVTGTNLARGAIFMYSDITESFLGFYGLGNDLYIVKIQDSGGIFLNESTTQYLASTTPRTPAYGGAFDIPATSLIGVIEMEGANDLANTTTMGPGVYTSNYSQWLGVARETKTSGQSCQIALPGSYISGLGGMTPRDFQYVQIDGTISSAPTAYKIGMAISSNTLLITEIN